MPSPNREKRLAYGRERRATHPEEIRAHYLKWRMAHPGVAVVHQRRWRAAHLEQVRAASRKRSASHLEENAAWVRNWRAVHPEEAKAKSRAWYAAHREEEAVRNRAWYAAHPVYAAIASHRRRTRIAGLPVAFTPQDWDDTLKAYHFKCVYCGSKKNLAMDHVIPVIAGGGFTKGNIVPACKPCNSRKRANAPPIPVQLGLV